MALRTEIIPIRPATDQWDQDSQLTLEFSIRISEDLTPPANEIECTVEVQIYDTVSPTEYREENALIYTTPTGAVYASGWTGRYVTYAPDNLRDLSNPNRRFVVANASLLRADAIPAGTPVCVLITPSIAAPVYYQWWFGVGPQASWYIPRERETTKLSGSVLPGLLAPLAGKPVMTTGAGQRRTSSFGSGLSPETSAERFLERVRLSTAMLSPRTVDPPEFESRYVP